MVTAGSPLSNVTLNGQNVTSSITTGQIGALLQLRDTTLPNVTAEMNQFTNNLYNLTTNANLNTTNSGTNVTNSFTATGTPLGETAQSLGTGTVTHSVTTFVPLDEVMDTSNVATRTAS